MKHTVGECPLGGKCAKVIDEDTIEHCPWHVEVDMVNHVTTESESQWRCAMAWMPILLIENASTNRGQTAALESFRNETVKRQDVFNALASQSLALKDNS